MKPIRLGANRFPRFYRGGPAIDELRGRTPEAGGAFLPEDWVGSTTTAFGSAGDGLTRLEDGRSLGEAIKADPEGFRAERLRPPPAAALEAAFSILVVTGGSGQLDTTGGSLELGRGDTVLVPYAAGPGEVRGRLEAVRALPPTPEAAPAPPSSWST